MPSRLPHVFVEIGRFMVTGGLSTIVSFSVFNFLAHGLYLTKDPWLGYQPITAFVIASLVGMVVSYRLSRYWTFRHRPPVHADGGRTAFFVINLVTMPLSIFCLWFSRHVLHLTDPSPTTSPPTWWAPCSARRRGSTCSAGSCSASRSTSVES